MAISSIRPRVTFGEVTQVVNGLRPGGPVLAIVREVTHMTTDELEREAHDFIDDMTNVAPGNRHLHLNRLHGVMGAYYRSGQAAPIALRLLLDEMTEEAVQARFENVPI